MSKREAPEINAGSVADIAFLLLIFFLVATTMDIDSGITRLLPPIPDTEQAPVKVKDRNILVVLINRTDQLMVGGKFGTRVDELREITIEFFTNPGNDPDLPEKETKEVSFPPGSSPLLQTDGVWRGNVSNGVISLQNDRSTTYGKYLEVQNELVAAVNTLRSQFCKQYFDKEFDELNEANPLDKDIKDGIRKIYKMNISEAIPNSLEGTK